MENLELRYLQRLAELYPTIAAASTEIINLEAIRNLPKGTEHFITDIHGEYEAFSHVLKNGSGSVKKKIDEVFDHTLSEADKSALATLIYYPNEKMALIRLVQNHSVPADSDLQEGILQIYEVKGAQAAAERLCLCDRGADHGEAGCSGQGSVLQFHC